MKLTLEDMRKGQGWDGYRLPAFDYDSVKKNTMERPRWVHFGSGNIFRIFPAKLCQRLLDRMTISHWLSRSRLTARSKRKSSPPSRKQ